MTTPSLHEGPPPPRRGRGKRRGNGFSLVEVVIALAITVFGSVSLISLIPIGLHTFRQAMDNTVESVIVQDLSNEIAMTSFKDLSRMASSGGMTYYFDADGQATEGRSGSLYTAEISFKDATVTVTPLSAMSITAGSTALITITKMDKTKDYFSVVTGNNQQVAGNPTAPATW